MPPDLNESRTQLAGLKWLAVAIVVLLIAVLLTTWRRARSVPPLPAVLSASTPRISELRCAECHSEIVTAQQSSPHARTLTRITERSIDEHFAGRSFHRNELSLQFHYEAHDGKLTVSTPGYARKLPIEWVFGSGTHAQTPLLTWLNDKGSFSGIEHGVSWYPDGQLGVTLGLEEQTASAGIEALGHPRTAAETINCFGCHCTLVPTSDGRILFDQIEPGVGCVRCHWNMPQHVREMESGLTSTIEKFSRMTPHESVDRCGECHRRADEMGGPIEKDDRSIARFASVGFVQSPCFLQQSEITLANGQPARFDCVSCHDPHRPTQRDWSFHSAVCLKCHDTEQHRAPDCTAATRESNCLSCHMPQVPSNEHLQFTDHWIRIRDRKQP